MNYQKRLIGIFRAFVQKALVPQIRKFQGSLGEWGRFSALLSNEIINFNELQIFVDSLPPFPQTNFLEKKQLPLHLRKREDSGYMQSFEGNFNPSKTFGGEKSKNIIIGIRQLQGSDSKRQSKEFSQGKQYIIKQDDSFKKPNITSMPNIGNPPQNYPNLPVAHSLERLLKQLIENQQKIQLLQSKIH